MIFRDTDKLATVWLTEKSLLNSGRIGWVTYKFETMVTVPAKSVTMAFRVSFLCSEIDAAEEFDAKSFWGPAELIVGIAAIFYSTSNDLLNTRSHYL